MAQERTADPFSLSPRGHHSSYSRVKIWFCCLLLLGITALAQTTAPSLAPEVAPLAAKHMADLAAIEQQRTAALSPYLPAYFTRLDAEEKTALNHGDIEAVAVIRKERDAVKAGNLGDLVAAPLPDKLPASLKPSRTTVFEAFKRLNAQAVVARRKADADYLAALGALQSRMAANVEVVRQIQAESDAVLGNPVTKPEGDVEVATKKGKLINGDFSQVDGNGFPVGWKLVLLGLENTPPPSETFKVAQEKNHSFLHTAFEQPSKGFAVVQVVDVPSYANEAELTLHLRGHLSPEKGRRIVQFHRVDKTGRSAGYSHIDPIPDPTWKIYSAKVNRDGGKTYKQVEIQLEGRQFMGGVTGYLDFSRIELRFK